MKQFYGVTLLSLYTFVLLMPCFHFAYFFANREYIQTFLCINKEQPKLKCNGKCFLAKKLQESYQDSSSQEQSTFYSEANIFLISFLAKPSNVFPINLGDKQEGIYQEALHGVIPPEIDPLPS